MTGDVVFGSRGQNTSTLHDGNKVHVYQVVWPWSLQFGLYSTYKLWKDRQLYTIEDSVRKQANKVFVINTTSAFSK